jgi:hypothetical protein
MAATIKIKNSSTASAVPTSSDLVQGELAVNVTDKRIFTENASGTVVELGTNPSILTLPDGSASAPTLTNDGDTNTGLFFPAADTVGITTGGTERARVDSSGNLGLGVTPSAWGSGYTGLDIKYLGISNTGAGTVDCSFTQNGYYNGTNWVTKYTSPSKRYSISDSGHIWYNGASTTAGSAITFTQAMTLDASGNLALNTTSPTNPANKNFTVNGGSTDAAFVLSVADTRIGQLYAASGSEVRLSAVTAVPLTFRTNDTERARIDSSGALLVGKTAVDNSVVGVTLEGDGAASIVRSAATALVINRLASDGDLVSFRQANTQEGTISVSGTTVSYNGGHLARYAQTVEAKDESLKKGTVLSNLDEMNTYTDSEGNPVANEQLNKVKVSDVEGDASVAGVFVNWSHDEQHNVDEINMAMTGDMIIRIAQGTTVVRGDLLMSAGDGTAKPQGDDIVRAKTIAKVTSTHVTCTYEDGSYCVPCVLMAC